MLAFGVRYLAILLVVSGCIVNPQRDAGPDAPDAGAASEFPAPRDDLIDPLGDEETIEVATWNIENFPANASTPSVVADLVTSMGLDVVAVEEIADLDAWDELVARLPRHEGVLSVHTYGDGSFQKVGFLYRADLLAVSDVRLLFTGSSFVFPRPPMAATFTHIASGYDFTAIVVHLKAGQGTDDRERRALALEDLEVFIADLVDGPADDEVLLLGDFNEVLFSQQGRETFGRLLSDPLRYRVLTDELPPAAVSFLPAEITLDHIVSTNEMNSELPGFASIPALNEVVANFESGVSDHLPVVVSVVVD